MIYNILDGAVNTLPQVIEVVKSEAPDYLMLNEANTFAAHDNKILKEFAQQTDFPHFDIALSGQEDYHVAVFSKYPFKDVHKLQPLARACHVALIDSPLGELSVASLHLTPFTEDLRRPEIDLIADFQKKYDKRVLMGDMNSLSRYDEYDPAIVKDFYDKLIKKFTSDGKLRFDAIDKILSMGYYDTAVELGGNKENTVPTPLPVEAIHQHHKMRLDYIFVSKPLLPHIRNYLVIKNALTDKASDHYPVTVELK